LSLYSTDGLPGSWDKNWSDERARTIEGSIRLAEVGLEHALFERRKSLWSGENRQRRRFSRETKILFYSGIRGR
jgi:hypothetical protein